LCSICYEGDCGLINPLTEIHMFKYTKTTLQKIETLFKELEYTIRYERGNFQSGYCIVENRKIAVVNKFFDTEARINCLIEILSTLEFDESQFSEKTLDFYQKMNKALEKAAEKEENDEVVEG
ncbi:MAG: hypothetical protein AAFO94_06955, partial [Bacteroidota bacterium]